MRILHCGLPAIFYICYYENETVSLVSRSIAIEENTSNCACVLDQHVPVSFISAYCYTILVLYVLIPLIPRILDIVIPLNESRPLRHIYEAEYKVDKDKYYYPILLHAFISSVTTIGIILTIDSIYIVCVLHACSLFTAISHRLENIICKTDAEIYNNEETHTGMHYHLLIEKHDSGSSNDDYHELMACLKKHQLALEYVLREILSSIISDINFVNINLINVITYFFNFLVINYFI
nr:PREDICTED: uncharacterized protein LOC105677626 [Linepithema humile]